MASHRSSGSNSRIGIVKRLEVILQSCPESAELAESLIAQFSEQAGCDDQQRSEICLALRETVVNAVLHGNRGKTTKRVYLKAEYSRSCLKISVRDQGKGFDPSKVRDPRLAENLMRESGRGLLLMKSLMDRVAIHPDSSNGTEVRLIKFLKTSKKEEHGMSLKVSSRQVDGVTILDLNGKIILGEATAILRDTLQDFVTRGQKKVLLNLGGITYIDSSGLGALVSGFTTLTNQQGELKLLNLTKKVKDLLQITKLLTVFEVHDDENTAVQSFR